MPNTTAILKGGIAINEVMIDEANSGNAVTFDTNSDGTADRNDEFIELVNLSGSTINIGGLELWDPNIGNYFTFPEPTNIAPGGLAVVVNYVTGGTLPTVPAGSAVFSADANVGTPVPNISIFSNSGDNMIVYDPGADVYIQFVVDDPTDDPTAIAGFSATATRIGPVETVTGEDRGHSVSRLPDGDTSFVAQATPTPGQQNLCFCAGTLIQTDDQEKPVESLQIGDLVATADGRIAQMGGHYTCLPCRNTGS